MTHASQMQSVLSHPAIHNLEQSQIPMQPSNANMSCMKRPYVEDSSYAGMAKRFMLPNSEKEPMTWHCASDTLTLSARLHRLHSSTHRMKDSAPRQNTK